jgi:trehalose-phosphatase
MPASVLLATDFDGTIAPIVRDYTEARMHPAARALLSRVNVPVAILSGRDVTDVRARLDGMRAIVAGAHGIECEDADGRVLWTSERAFPEPPPEVLDTLQGLRIERKKYAMAIHFRGVEGGDASAFEAWARDEGLHLFLGRKIVEARVPGGGKGVALERIAQHVGAQRVLFAGDDTTDFEGMAYAAVHGRAFFVKSAEREAPDIAGLVIVESIEELCDAFARELSD